MIGQPYTVIPCECGHTEALHASARTSWPHPPKYGVCLVAGCDCREYTPDQATTTGGRKDDSHGMEALPDSVDRTAA